MAKASANTGRCKECRLCVELCPAKAIYPKDEVNSNGYQIIGIHLHRCTGCGVCYRVCPDYVFTISEETEHA